MVDIEIDDECDEDDFSCDDCIDCIIEMLGLIDDFKMLGCFNNYEICGLIGWGSIGIVFKVFELSFNWFVVIKVFLFVYFLKGVVCKWFECEGCVVVVVIYENIVLIYVVDEYGGLLFIVM